MESDQEETKNDAWGGEAQSFCWPKLRSKELDPHLIQAMASSYESVSPNFMY